MKKLVLLMLLAALAVVMQGCCDWCEEETTEETTETGGIPGPPSPIIVIDPNADISAGGSTFTIDGVAAYNSATENSCTDDYEADSINEIGIGAIDFFKTVRGTSTAQLIVFEADIEYDGVTQTLRIERGSSGFDWTLDDVTLYAATIPDERPNVYTLRRDLCEGQIVATPNIVWPGAEDGEPWDGIAELKREE